MFTPAIVIWEEKENTGKVLGSGQMQCKGYFEQHVWVFLTLIGN